MKISKAILILSMSWLGLAFAKSVSYSSFNGCVYPDKIAIRIFPELRREKNFGDARQSNTFQKYWQSFVRSISPLRWNVTNSLSNIFNGGTHNIIETPVVSYPEDEPMRKRKSSKRKSSAKKSKSRRKLNSRNYSHYYGYSPYPNGLHQLQLQLLGSDKQNNIHFYEANTGNYYAMHLISPPNQYNQQHYYDPQYPNHNTGEDDNDYEDEEHSHEYDHEYGHVPEENEDHEDSEYPEESDEFPADNYDTDHSDNDYDGYGDQLPEVEVEPGDDNSDESAVSDSWGYTDEDSTGERNLKVSLNPIKLLTETNKQALKTNITNFQKNLLKPATEDGMLLLSNKQDGNLRKFRPNLKKSTDDDLNVNQAKRIPLSSNQNLSQDNEIESMRNALGSYMKDDYANRRRQSAVTKPIKYRFVEKPRERKRFYLHSYFS